MTTTSETWHLDGQGVEVTHPDKTYWPEEGYTKRQLLSYYRDMAPTLLPYCKDRPVTLHLFPRGVEDLSYYRRDMPEDAPSWLRYVDYVQNSIGHNTAVPYTVRAHPGAPVSTPVTWDEVEDGRIRPGDFTLLTVPPRVAQLGDLFAPALEERWHL